MSLPAKFIIWWGLLTCLGCGVTTPGGSSVISPVQPVSPVVTAPPKVNVSVTGPAEVVFSYNTQACSAGDIPDEGARAWRDSSGMVHLMASGTTNLQMIGTTLDSVKRQCTATYQDSGSADPSRFDDAGWLETFYTIDGRTVYGFVSHDYHPGRHNLPCASSPADTSDKDNCWYSNIISASSVDGGYTFTSPPPGVLRFVAGAPYVFDSTHTATTGALVPSNIVAFDGAYYMLLGVANDRAQVGGDCLLRTTNLSDPASWRAWDGNGFSMQFMDPYTTPNLDPTIHVCTPVSPQALQWWARSLMELPDGKGFIISMAGSSTDGSGKTQDTVMVSTSADLIHWSSPVPLINLLGYGATACAANPFAFFYAYPSLLDPSSTSMNFNTVGTTAYLYVTRFNGCPTPNRDLVRYPINIGMS